MESMIRAGKFIIGTTDEMQFVDGMVIRFETPQCLKDGDLVTVQFANCTEQTLIVDDDNGNAKPYFAYNSKLGFLHFPFEAIDKRHVEVRIEDHHANIISSQHTKQLK